MKGSYSKFLPALVVVVALGAWLAAFNTSAADQPPMGADAKPAPKEITLTGRVFDPDGKPLAGAKLFARHLDALKEVGTSGADGTFTVKVPAGAATLFARAEGAGLDFLTIPPERPGKEKVIELRLVKDHPVRGRILDTQGRPVAGATVDVSRLNVCNDNSLDWYLEDIKRGLNPITHKNLSKSVSYESGILPPATTDKDGRFTIEGAGAERVVTLRVSGAGLAETELRVINRKDFDSKAYNGVKPAPFKGGGLGGGPPGGGPPRATVIYHGPDGSAIVETGKRIRGTVTDVDTGKPWAGAKVTLVSDGRAVVPLPLSAVTDAEGKYEIRGAHKSPSYALAIDSDPATRYVATRVRVDDTAGYEPLAADIKVKKGVLVTGRMIDTSTKEPVSGFASITVLAENKFVKEYPGFDPRARAIVATGEGGMFRIVTIPGPVLLKQDPAPGAVLLRQDPLGSAPTRDLLAQYKDAVPDPKYPQYFSTPPKTRINVILCYGGSMYGLTRTHFCKVLEIKADAETVAQDILLEPEE